jgi:hypothetical protein
MIGHMPKDIAAESVSEMIRKASEMPSSSSMYPRTHDEITRFFTGLEFVEPGLVPLKAWRPGSEFEAKARAISWGGVGRKP